MRSTLIPGVLAAALCLGVTAPAANADIYAGVSVGTPPLVDLYPGVQVVEDYDYPVFYADGYYWRYNDGYWYRSDPYANGWIFVDRPPLVISRIDRPYRYVHYRPHGYVVRHQDRYWSDRFIRPDYGRYARPTYYGDRYRRGGDYYYRNRGYDTYRRGGYDTYRRGGYDTYRRGGYDTYRRGGYDRRYDRDDRR